MKTRMWGGLSILALSVAAGGLYESAALAGDRSSGAEAKTAQVDADKARAAIVARNGAAAVRYAELAVGLAPRDGGYRAMLGQAYMLAGRFASARAALADALSLKPGDGKAALNLALSQIAGGDWSGARATLDANAGSVPLSDRALALALAGDPAGAVDILVPLARQPDAEPKLRQNLALCLALAGRWQDARLVAAIDLSPADTDRRMEQWAAFARPTGKADQVASLLGVVPVSDPGQPVALALNAAAPVGVAAFVPRAPEPVAESAPVAPETAAAAASATPTPVLAIAAPVAPVPAAAVAPPVVATPGVVFGPRAEVVQALPVKPAVGLGGAFARAAKPARSFVKPVTALSTPGARTVSVGKGNFVVQLGAYDSAGVARDGWARASRAYSGFAGQAPQGVAFTVGGKAYYRLSVGGYDRVGAARVCAAYRAKGGKCFVRVGAGDAAMDLKKK